MERGHIAQEGAPEDIYANPTSRFVADFIGSSNFIEAEIVEAREHNRWVVQAPWGQMLCTGRGSYEQGAKVVAVVRPEKIDLTAEPDPGRNAIKGMLKSRFFLGPFLEYFFEVGGVTLRVQRTSAIAAGPGDVVFATIDPANCQIVGPAELPAPVA
jgi:ABC-type Fe3+/spermidine/putrescine transport system ATPase subunit